MDNQSDTSSVLMHSFLDFTRAVIARWRTELEATPDEPEDRRTMPHEFHSPRHMQVLQPLIEDLAQLDEARHMVEAHAHAGRFFLPPVWTNIAGMVGSPAWNSLFETLTKALATVIQYHGLAVCRREGGTPRWASWYTREHE